jgi:predicted transcriptional regulator
MRQETVHYFTREEEKFVDLLIDIGMKKNVAILLVFLTNTPVATSREIERGTDLRQPEVSMAMRYLMAQGWVKDSKSPSENKGRPQKKYSLAVPIKDIFASIERIKKYEADNQLELVRKMRDYF